MTIRKCRHGHEQTPENVYTSPKGKSYCRICGRKATLAYQKRNYVKRLAVIQEWKHAHPDKVREYRRRTRQHYSPEQKAHILEQNRKYYRNLSPEKKERLRQYWREYKRRYYAEHKEEIRARALEYYYKKKAK